MIYDLKKSVDLRRLFDPVLHSSLDDVVLKQMAKYDVLQTYNFLGFINGMDFGNFEQFLHIEQLQHFQKIKQFINFSKLA